MFIYLENLIENDGIKEELFLIPPPQYIKITNSQKMRINEGSILYTNLSVINNDFIEQLQNFLKSP